MGSGPVKAPTSGSGTKPRFGGAFRMRGGVMVMKIDARVTGYGPDPGGERRS
jgi:hypothetical protein